MKRYLIRSAKYFVALCVLCAAIMLLNQLYGATLSFSQTLYVMFHTPRGLLMLGEDEIRVSQYGQWIRLEGIRRGVARAAYRLESFIERRRNE